MVMQIEDLKEQQKRTIDKITDLNKQLNKDVLDLYQIIQKLTKNHKKSSENVFEKKVTKESEEEIRTNKKCRFYNVGYCRSKSNCSFLHPTTFCKTDKCNDKDCSNRHVKNCKNFFFFCKFGDSCEFRHDSKKLTKNTKKRN